MVRQIIVVDVKKSTAIQPEYINIEGDTPESRAFEGMLLTNAVGRTKKNTIRSKNPLKRSCG